MERHEYRLVLSFETGAFEVACGECGKVLWTESVLETQGDCVGHPPDLGISIVESISVVDVPHGN